MPKFSFAIPQKVFELVSAQCKGQTDSGNSYQQLWWFYIHSSNSLLQWASISYQFLNSKLSLPKYSPIFNYFTRNPLLAFHRSVENNLICHLKFLLQRESSFTHKSKGKLSDSELTIIIKKKNLPVYNSAQKIRVSFVTIVKNTMIFGKIKPKCNFLRNDCSAFPKMERAHVPF